MPIVDFVAGFLFAWCLRSLLDRGLRQVGRRGSNPPPPDRKPAPPAGPPEQPLTAQLIRYWAWEQEQVRQAWIDQALGEPWPEDRKPAPPAGSPEQPIRFDEGPTQRGHGHGGPTTPKPLIKPQPTGPRMVGDSIKPPPIKPQFPPPRKIREDFS